MLYTIAVVLAILWLLGLVTSYTMGGFIHILLVIAVVMILVNFIQGRKRLWLAEVSNHSTFFRKDIVNKIIFLALLAGGIVLVILGINATNSFSSDVSRFFTGSPTDKAVWMLIGGIVASVIGLVGTLRNWNRA
jgi:hypothetical protein